MAIIKKYQAEVIDIKEQAEGVYTLEIKTLGRSFKYSPGQFLHFALDEYDPSYGWPESRCFSMQTSPENETIKLTYSVKGEYTRRMTTELKVGSLVCLKLPYGDLFSQMHSKKKAIFIAGGTGVTPFLSLITDLSFNEYSHPHLYLGLRTRDHDFYKEELDQALSINSELLITKYFQDTDGILNIADILSQNGLDSNYFISGPPEMISAFRKYLTVNGVLSERIITDDWE